MALMTRTTHDPKLTRWWWRTLREWVYELVDPLWGAFRGENSDDIALANVTGINDVSASELGVLDGITATTSEINKLSGLTADIGELNKADRAAGDGIAEASKNVVLDASKDVLGKRYDINRSLVEAVANRPFMWFDGVNDYVAVGDNANIDFGTGDFSLFAVAIPQAVDGNYHLIASKGQAADPALQFGIRTSNKFYISYSTSAQGTSLAESDDEALEGQVYVLVGVADRDGNTKLYVNGIIQSSPATGHSGDITNSQSLHIGKGSTTLCWEGGIYRLYLFNRAINADEIKALSSGAPVGFADIGASQADLVTNGEDWTGATGSTPPNNWSDSGPGTATYIIRDNTPVANFGDDKALEINASGGSKTLYQSVAQAGKRYRVSFVYRNLDGSSSSYVALGSSDNKVTLQNTGISGDGILFEQELLADGTDLKFFVDTGGTLQIDHVEVIQIGCVAAYLPEGITHAQWQDASGNELHGSVSGAVPLNLPSNHVASYIKLGITGDTTLTDAVPAGYRIKSMVAEVTGAGSGMILNVGSTSGGSDVVNGQDISANGLFDLTVAKNIFSLSSAQSLYVNDDGGTAWSGVSVDLYIDLERVK